MEKTFLFIDGHQADRSTKRLMRRHVMMGKNAGKTIHRPSRRDLDIKRRPAVNHTYPRVTSGFFEEPEAGTGAAWTYVEPNTIARALGNTLLTIRSPVNLTPYAIEVTDTFFNNVADRIYHVQLGIAVHDAKFMWLNILFADESSFRCSLALMQACNEIFLGPGPDSPKALHHLAETLFHVNARLQGEDALSDSTLAIVVSLINQEQIRNEHSGARVHIDGVRRIVALRGGLDELGTGNLPLMLKICKTDILFSLQQGDPPIFFRDEMQKVRDALALRQSSYENTVIASLIRHHDLRADLYDILLDIISICSFFNDNPFKMTLDLTLFLECQTSICYRLLRFHGLGSPWPDQTGIAPAYHTGLTIFMMTMFLQYDRRRMLDYSLISACLWHALEGDVVNQPQHQELALWLMILGGVWISGEGNVKSLRPRIRATADRLRLESWEDVRGCLGKYPWIQSIHDEPGRALWKQVCDHEFSA